MTVWQRLGRLLVDCDGMLWQRYRAGWHWRGPIQTARPPEGDERDYHRLLALWLDRFSPRDEQRMLALG